MRMPKQVTGKPASEWLCRGQVVRVEEDELRNEKHCVGVAFQYYEVIEGAEACTQN